MPPRSGPNAPAWARPSSPRCSAAIAPASATSATRGATACAREKFERLTRDHSLLQEQIDSGMLTPERARYSLNKNLVTRALGIEEVAPADVAEYRLEADDTFLFCSDGLTDMVDDDVIGTVLAERDTDLDGTAGALVELANRNGGRDNISIILVRVPQEFLPPQGWVQRWRAKRRANRGQARAVPSARNSTSLPIDAYPCRFASQRCTHPGDGRNPGGTRTRTTEMLSRPPLRLARSTSSRRPRRRGRAVALGEHRADHVGVDHVGEAVRAQQVDVSSVSTRYSAMSAGAISSMPSARVTRFLLSEYFARSGVSMPLSICSCSSEWSRVSCSNFSPRRR